MDKQAIFGIPDEIKQAAAKTTDTLRRIDMAADRVSALAVEAVGLIQDIRLIAAEVRGVTADVRAVTHAVRGSVAPPS